jgi:tetratricopeptide (TPR) repeat protein
MSGGHAANRVPSLDEMKRVADKQATPLLEKLKTDPNDTALLVQAGDVYYRSHQFGDATTYYDRAVKADPRNVALRTKLSSSLYRSGDVDGAIAELNRALRYDPNDANSLFNLGTIRLQGKGTARARWPPGSNVEVQPGVEPGPQSGGAETDGRCDDDPWQSTRNGRSAEAMTDRVQSPIKG